MQLTDIIEVSQLEQLVRKKLSMTAFTYFNSGSNDEITLDENIQVFKRVQYIPRILTNIGAVDTKAVFLQGKLQCHFPMYITATAMARLAHNDGEKAILKASYNRGVIYMVPTLSSFSLDQILIEKNPDQQIMFQLYAKSDREYTRQLIMKAQKGGAKALVLTVDAPQLGRRESDLRAQMLIQMQNQKISDQNQSQKSADPSAITNFDRSKGIAQGLTSFIDNSLDWGFLGWLKQVTDLPIILKGIQCKEDAVLAYRHGMAAIIISNHGGRQVDTCRSSLEILPEVMKELQKVVESSKRKQMEVFIDGGIRKGSDIFKALALGAKVVGVGRPIIYGLGCFGQEGIEKVLDILLQEFEYCMRVMGVSQVSQICSNNVNAEELKKHQYFIKQKDSFQVLMQSKL